MNQNDPNEDVEIVNAFGAYHDFWLIRPDEIEFEQFQHYFGRKDAPIRLSDDVINYIENPLKWVPNIYPGRHETSTGYGLANYGVTIIAPPAGERFRQICLGWAQIFAQGPEPLILTQGWTCIDDGERAVTNNYVAVDWSLSGTSKEALAAWHPYRFRVSRADLVRDLEHLGEFGAQVASGEYFLLHLGI